MIRPIKLLAILAMTVILSQALVSATTVTAGPVNITGPTKVAIGSTFNYTVDVQQIFQHYKIIFLLSGYNLTGASPISPQYLNGTFSPQNITITAPSVQTTLFLFFEVVATLNGQTFYYNITQTVQVLNYTILTAKIYNPSGFILKDVNVSFFVNNNYVGSSTLNISGNTTENVTYKWVSGILAPGIYNVQVEVNNSILKIKGGSYSISIQAGNPYIGYVYIIIGIIVAIVVIISLLTVLYNRRNKPKWKK